MLHAVIMAGGSGTRFWPASRREQPKQLLDIAGDRTMIQDTVHRLGEVVPPERVLIVTNQRLVAPIQEQLPELPAESIIGEPCKRDTAPCIGWSAGILAAKDPDATMVVMPADHVISPDDVFQQAISFAAQLVEQSPDRIVTFGIKPTYPSESFGYIARGEPVESGDGPPTFQVDSFREKPTADVAQQYLDAGTYYWNSGIFAWKARTILDSLEKFEPKMYTHLQRIAEAAGSDQYDEVLEREFAAIDGKSIDYAVMERADDVVVIEAPYEWDDVGGWRSLARLRGKDDSGNTMVGRTLALDTSDSIIRTTGDHLVVTLGMQDAIVVHTPDATLVADKESEAQIRQVVKMLGEKGWEEYL